MKFPALVMLVGLTSAGLPSVAAAQAPTMRPGLPAAPSGVQQPFGTPASTDLVQRDFSGNGQGATMVQQPQLQPQQDNFFYVPEGSQAPANFANDLGEYNGQMMDQAGSQLTGDYGSVMQQTMPAGQIQDAWNRPFDNMSQGQSAPGVIRYQWSADLVMPVRLRAGMVSNIILPDWDAVEDVVIGDGGAVEATILRSNVVGVKSVQTGYDTSLSVIGGSGNIYTFYLRTEGRNTKVVTDMQVFVQAAPSRSSGEWFNDERRNVLGGAAGGVPGGAPSTAGGMVTADGSPVPTRALGATQRNITLPGSVANGDEPVPVDKRVFNMRMFEVNKGDRIIAPEYVYTDGRFTYLHYPAGVTDRPAVFRVVDGVEGRVNTRVMGRNSEIIVVEALGSFVLRSGQRTVCLVQTEAAGAPISRP